MLSYLKAYTEKPERLVVGLMSGTSADGVDAALVRISGSERATQAEIVAFVTIPFAPEVRSTVLAVSHGEGNAETVSRLSFTLGHCYADAVQAVLAEATVPRESLD